MQTGRLLSFSSNSPSFGSFSSAVDLAAIAARVVEEFRKEEETQSDSPRRNDDDDDDSEFAFDCPSNMCSQPLATADEIFCNGQIRPLNPYGCGIGNVPVESQPTPRRHRPALRKLMSEERDPTSNSSSEAEEDLNGVPPETYCVWTPKQSNYGDASPSQSKIKIKSNSAGFSKRWKLRNLLYVRGISEGNEKLVFPAPVKKSEEIISDHRGGEEEEEEEEEPPSKVAGEQGRERGETKRQTYVPYRKDMIGIFKNVNGLSRHLRPF